MSTEFSLEVATSLFTSSQLFPVKFSDAWQWLEYSRKDSAKRFLLDNLEEDIDFRRNVDSTQSQFGTPEQIISLSVEGFKNWAMLSKTPAGKLVRKYFIECERIAKTKVDPQSKPLTIAELILAQAQVVVDLERSILKVTEEQINQKQTQISQDYRLKVIEKRSLNAVNSLKLLPESTVKPEQMTTKANLSRLVRSYVAANNLDYKTTWNSLFREHRDRTHVDIKVRGKNHKPQLSAPEYAEKYGYIEQLYAVAYEIFVSRLG